MRVTSANDSPATTHRNAPPRRSCGSGAANAAKTAGAAFQILGRPNVPIEDANAITAANVTPASRTIALRCASSTADANTAAAANTTKAASQALLGGRSHTPRYAHRLAHQAESSAQLSLDTMVP